MTPQSETVELSDQKKKKKKKKKQGHSFRSVIEKT